MISVVRYQYVLILISNDHHVGAVGLSSNISELCNKNVPSSSGRELAGGLRVTQYTEGAPPIVTNNNIW